MVRITRYQECVNYLKQLDKNVPAQQQIESEDITYILYLAGFGVCQHTATMHLLLFGKKYVDPIFLPEMKQMVVAYNEKIDASIATGMQQKPKSSIVKAKK